MMGLLLLRDKIKNFYTSHEFICFAIIKFLMVLIGLILVKDNIGYMESLKKMPVILAVAGLSAFLPMGVTILILAAVILANIYALSMYLAAVSLGALIVMFIIYYRFTPKESVMLVLIPMMFYLKVPYLAPLAIGLVGTPISVVTAAFGTIVYYMINLVSVNSATINNMDSDSAGKQIEYYIDLFINSQALVFTMGIFAIVILVVYTIKKMSINNSWTIAVVVGGMAELILFEVSSLTLKEIDDPVMIAVECVISIVLAVILQFFIFSVDYTRCEHTQFEDDEYYYYVKAVPKINVVAPEMNIKRINAKRQNKTRNAMRAN